MNLKSLSPFIIMSALFVLAVLDATLVRAQSPARRSTPNDTLKSVEVAPDRKVTFKIYAPKAEVVSVGGDFGPAGKMTKDDEGVWSLTVGPLTPDFYSYKFTVDDVRTIDPKNPMVKPGINSLDNMFFVPGDEAEFEATKDVPHGELRAVSYQSAVLGGPRRMHVYTPPGYERSDAKYPVFYVLHGSGDEDSGWSTIGRAGFILDNLIASGKAVPMIVVMPNGSIPQPPDMPARPARGETPSPQYRAASEKLQRLFTDELLQEVVPRVEQTYRVKTGAENRALAGLSMGGGQTLRVLVTHPDQFGYLGIWSAGINAANSDQWEKQHERFLTTQQSTSGPRKHLEIVVGDQDMAQSGSKALSEILKKHGIEHELRITGGGHTWINWRHYLNEFAPKLFRSSPPQE